MKEAIFKYTLAFLAFVATSGLEAKSLGEMPDSSLAKAVHKEVALQRQIAFELAPVKNKNDAEFHALQSDSSFNLLSERSKAVFLNSLVFNDSGLVSFNYSVLENELTPTQAYKLLQLFGKQHVVHVLTNARIETTLDYLLLENKGFPNSSPSMGVNGFSGGVIGIGGEDHKGYKCVSRANCQETATYICMSSC
uniref:hypothetical protein n=1 Tax=Ningiella ruwaisensis TaxID=2364274 RepID=UPI0010A06C60|nr:hypothetical protein [Ningiella ruwaisensis]